MDAEREFIGSVGIDRTVTHGKRGLTTNLLLWPSQVSRHNQVLVLLLINGSRGMSLAPGIDNLRLKQTKVSVPDGRPYSAVGVLSAGPKRLN